MKFAHPALLFVTVLSLTFCLSDVSTRASEPVWKSIADGKTLAGWHKNGEGDWKVEDGAYVGRSNKAKLYGHLVSDQQYQDFVVRFKFQCSSGDSGFFIRTKMEEPDKTNGLQIQVGPCGSGTGGIYESYGRGWLQKPTKEQEAFCYREGGWNEMIIAAKGPRVTVHVNGFKTADLNDEKIRQGAGVFALQMHSGVVNHTMFKDLAVLEKGDITPRSFLYDAIKPVKPATDGALNLRAADAMTAGPEIMYLPARGVIGHFSCKGMVSWPVQVDQPGDYDVWIEGAATDGQAANRFTLQVGKTQLTGKVDKIGLSETGKAVKIGQVKLGVGAQQVVLKPVGQFDGTLMILRQVKLVPRSGTSEGSTK